MGSIPSTSVDTTAAAENGKNDPNLQKSGKLTNSPKSAFFPGDPSSDPLELTRPDWTEFRDPSRISAKAGVKLELLPKVMAKELVDNALDNSGSVDFGFLTVTPEEVCFYVEDVGTGIPGTDASIASRFSMRRPLTSSKTLRRPTRGMLGNGLRVVAGVICICDGVLKVSTRNRTLTLKPQFDNGSTAVIGCESWKGSGTRIEVTLRGDFARYANQCGDLFEWAQQANELTSTPFGKTYKGKSSPWWYGPSDFLELLKSAGRRPVEHLVQELNGYTNRKKAYEVTGPLLGRMCNEVTRDE